MAKLACPVLRLCIGLTTAEWSAIFSANRLVRIQRSVDTFGNRCAIRNGGGQYGNLGRIWRGRFDVLDYATHGQTKSGNDD